LQWEDLNYIYYSKKNGIYSLDIRNPSKILFSSAEIKSILIDNKQKEISDVTK